MKMNGRMPIQLKITILSFAIVLFSLIIGGVILIGRFMHQKEEDLSNKAMITARTVAQLPEIQKYIVQKNEWNTINPMIEKIRIINNVTYIVVMNMEHIRYSDPVTALLGTVSNSNDESPAFADHTYLSKAKGELGIAIRAFVPIMNENREQIGVVVVGNLLPTFTQMIFNLKSEIFIIFFLTLLFGVLGSWLLAIHIKRETFQLEPHEIAQLLVERTATFHAMHEGVIAIDNQQKITVFNERAKDMLGIENSVVGHPITEVIPETELHKVLELNQPEYNIEMHIGPTQLLSNRIPIKVNEKTVGAVAIFQDRTEVTKMAEELTGVKAFVEALRVQTHEHMNKLHTIAGLIQLGNHDKALHYVFNVYDEYEQLSGSLSRNIKNDSISGLLISKVSRGKELGIQVIIDPHSKLHRFPDSLDQHDLVVILGNLIENAFHALEVVDQEKKKIYISIDQNSQSCFIMVEDNGIGIEQDKIDIIFERGFTTKGSQGSGIGLHLIKKIIDKSNGNMEVKSELGAGTRFMLTFPMNRGGVV